MARSASSGSGAGNFSGLAVPSILGVFSSLGQASRGAQRRTLRKIFEIMQVPNLGDLMTFTRVLIGK